MSLLSLSSVCSVVFFLDISSLGNYLLIFGLPLHVSSFWLLCILSSSLIFVTMHLWPSVPFPLVVPCVQGPLSSYCTATAYPLHRMRIICDPNKISKPDKDRIPYYKTLIDPEGLTRVSPKPNQLVVTAEENDHQYLRSTFADTPPFNQRGFKTEKLPQLAHMADS